MDDRYDRSIRLFGADGQARLRATAVAVVGCGGLGSPLVQHLALLGVKSISVIDPDELEESNRNRLVGARAADPVPGTLKVDILTRMVTETNPDVECVLIANELVSDQAFDAVSAADWVFGCFDDDGPRAILNELSAAKGKPYIDLASDVPELGIYGGRVCVAINGEGCLECFGLLDAKAVRRYADSPRQREAEDAIYGINRDILVDRGPSVSPINGVVAGLAVTEFMAAVTGMRAPVRLQEYRAWQSKVVVSHDAPAPSCRICHGVRINPLKADVERYLRLWQARE